MKASIRNQLKQRKQRIVQRLDKQKMQDPALIGSGNVQYEMAARTQAIAPGGLGVFHLVVQRVGLVDAINQRLSLLKLYAPYSESDHVLNIACNVLAGGTRLEHLELLRNNEVYLNALNVRRIPDPTTAGDFCRRFSRSDIEQLQDVFNDIRVKVWQQQSPQFFEEALIDVDGTMAVTSGECKLGMDINYKGDWGYNPLIVSLANTGEPLYLANRPGNRPSHEQSPAYLQRAIDLCRRAGFRSTTIRGDTDFALTAYFDTWHKQNVTFLFGMDASPKLCELAENLPTAAWKPLHRREKYQVQTQPRGRRTNVKEKIVQQREFENITLEREYVAEFDYRPEKCSATYRMVVVRKALSVKKGQQKLFDDSRMFFYITNDRVRTTEQMVRRANHRCNQENTVIEQLKNGVHAVTAPVDNLLSNWAYMVMASLAWSLKAWAALLLPAAGRWREQHQAEKEELLRMEFSTFRQAWINIPAQIVRTGRRIVYRFLGWTRWLNSFFRLVDVLQRPLRC